jgi:hypothetical protein
MEIIQNAAEFYFFQPEMSVVGPSLHIARHAGSDANGAKLT